MKAIIGLFLSFFAVSANAGIIYDTWTSNEGHTGNYIFTVEHDVSNNLFNYVFTINPWNAEGLGLFIDLGDVDVNNVNFANILSSAPMSLYGRDTSSTDCGQGCNLNGLNFDLSDGDGQWELVFRLGDRGFNAIQTFEWTTSDMGLTLFDFGIVGIRAQNLCDPGQTHDQSNANCGGSDKSFGSGRPDILQSTVSEPGVLVCLLMGLTFLAARRKV